MSMDRNLGIYCPGCGIPLTIDNAGGYQCYCDKCVTAMPPLPECSVNELGLMVGGFYLTGTYPNFKWEYEA